VSVERGQVDSGRQVRVAARVIAMKALTKFALVAGGYLAALLVAAAAVLVNELAAGAAGQTSSGMYAFGDMVLFFLVFAGFSLAPTSAALFFLRQYPRFWLLLSALGLGVAATSVATAVAFSFGREATASPLATWAAFGVLGMVVAPFLAVTLLIGAVIAPRRSPRFALLAATVLETAVGAYGCVLFVSMLLSNR
jgi:hypothetical protein